MKAAVFGAALVGLLSAGVAQADEGQWLVRGRIVSMQNDNGNSPSLSLGKVELDDKVFPEVDISYFFTKNIAAELILTYPQKHDVTLGGTKIGSIKQLPPTLLAQYHFLPDGQFDPYVGAGINYTRVWGAEFDPAVAAFDLSVEQKSIGPAVQVGMDYKIDKNWSVNVDVKYIDIKVDVKSAGTKLTELTVSPIIAAVGVGYRF
jgi:outer membrane protein